MLKNVVGSTPEEIIMRKIEFTSSEGYGYSFDADINGNPILTNEAQKSNYEYVMNHKEEFDKQFNEFVVYKHIYMAPAHGTCDCGTEVTLVNEYMGSVQCPHCGQWYNLFGQQLINPKYWED